MLQPDDHSDRNTRAATALSISLAEFILRLFAESDGNYPVMVGTGFLLEDRGSTFLISAAHVAAHFVLPLDLK